MFWRTSTSTPHNEKMSSPKDRTAHYWEGGIRTPDAGTKNQSLNRLATSQQRK